MMDNAMWIADEEHYPAPIPHLLPQQKKEILQVWLVREPQDELVEDTRVEVEQFQAKRRRQTHS